MAYIFRGTLCGYICTECPEFLSGVKVRIYRTRAEQNVTSLAVADAKETFAILTDDAIKEKSKFLIAEADTDERGNFSFSLDEKSYKGEAFEVDVYCATVPKRPPIPNPPPPIQFSLTVLQPMWRRLENNFVAAWEYCIPHRFWCGIRTRLGAWTICGKVTVCETKQPVPGVRVSAFDVDWLQDDPLGSAITGSDGKFRIDYTRAAFERTPFSPFINFEWVSGPDVYFKVETLGNAPLLTEPRSRGRQPDRENASPCLCVDLCLDEEPPPPQEPFPAFTHIGGYKFLTTIDSGAGGSGLTNGDNRAFFSTIRLNGIAAKRFNGQPLEYMFEVKPDGGGWVQVTQTQIGRTLIGQWEHFTGDPMNPVETKDYTVNGTAGPGELVTTFTADGWIKMPQENNYLTAEGMFWPNGNFIGLITQSIASWPSIDLTGLQAGNSSTSTGKPLAQDKLFGIRMWVREAGNPASQTIAGTCQTLAVDNTLYDNLSHHPSWAGFVQSNALAVAMLDIQELTGMGCAKIISALHPLFTAAHPNLGAVSITMTGPGGPYNFTLPAAVAGERFGIATPNGFVVGDLANCAYIVTLSVQVLLTTGDSVPSNLIDQIAFCKV